MKSKKTIQRLIKKLVLISLNAGGELDIDRVQNVLKYIANLESRQRLVLAKAYKKAIAQFEKSHTMTIEVANDLSKEEAAALTKEVSQRFGKGMQVIITENPALIGGLKLTASDMIYDESVLGKFEQMKEGF